MRGQTKGRTGSGAVVGIGKAGIFDDPKYKSTNQVQFRGQEKVSGAPLG
jgi:hypothetical protein